MKIWIFVIAWMALIIFFSGQSGDRSQQQSRRLEQSVRPAVETVQEELNVQIVDAKRLHFYIRRNAHVFLYFVLGAGLFLALRSLKVKRPFILAWVVGTLFGALDETIQSFIPGRTSRVVDVALDSFGVLLGLVAIVVVLRLRKRVRI